MDAWLSTLTQGTVFGLQGVTERVEVPVLTAVIFGLIGATAPCQLTTNLGVLAWVSAHAGRRKPTTLAIAYVAGKVTVYTLVGGLVILAGFQLQSVSVPVVIVARKGLFFGLTVPLALRSTGGLAFPGLFAIGASLPLLAITLVVGAGVGTASWFAGGVRRVERVLRVVAGIVLILAGLHDTVVYWLL